MKRHIDDVKGNMFIRRRLLRCRIRRVFLPNMAAFLVIFTVLFTCSSLVFVVSKNGTEITNNKNVDISKVEEHSIERILQYTNHRVASVGIKRHNRALQFLVSKVNEQDLSEDRRITDQQNYNATQMSFSDFNLQKQIDSYQHKRENIEDSLSSLNRGSSSLDLDEGYISVMNKNQQTDPTKMYDDSTYKYNHSEMHQRDSAKYLLVGKEVKSQENTTTKEVLVKRLPKAIIIGVKKSGTRALLEFLRLHPNVEGTGPEPHFFDRHYRKGLEWYRDLMPKTHEGQVTVEKTPGYFVTRDAPKRIFDMNPSIKLILVVRDPVTRAISDYCQAMSKHSMKPFEKMALLDERLGLVNTSWGAIKIGVYAKHMQHWLQIFSLDQIHLVDGQMLIEEPAREVAKVETFLGLPRYINDSHFFLRGFKGTFPCLIREGKPHCLDEKTKGRDHPIVKKSVLQRLRDFYRPFNAKFFQMVGRTFDWS